MYQAKDIAFYFVNRGIAEGKPVTQMQLQKMIYFAQGLCLADSRGSLIKEAFEAWKFGPVIPGLYTIYKLYGTDKIRDTFYLLSGIAYGGKPDTVEFEPKFLEVLDTTWNFLKDINVLNLSSWTHEENSPWDKAYKKGINTIISHEDMAEYFSQFIVKGEVGAAILCLQHT